MEKKRRVFYSFHYDNDVFRTQQIRHMYEFDDESRIIPNRWEEVRRKNDTAIKSWIDETMNGCSCLVVLVGCETADRKWVKYEIERAWNTNKGVVGIYIHKLEDPRNGSCAIGKNPFDKFIFYNGYSWQKLSTIINVYNPNADNPNIDIKNKLPLFVEQAISLRERHKEKVHEL